MTYQRSNYSMKLANHLLTGVHSITNRAYSMYSYFDILNKFLLLNANILSFKFFKNNLIYIDLYKYYS